jgi:hypothetical protein
MSKVARTLRRSVAGTTILLMTAVPAEAGSSVDNSLQGEVNRVLAQHPGGRQISDHQIAWNHGSVVLSLPARGHEALAAAGSVQGCPAGWFCFYADLNWGGRKLQFSDCSSGGTTQFLTDYGFGNQTSSWVVNRGLNFVNVNDNETGNNLWNEAGNSSSAWVGAAANDRADWFICYS